MRMLALVLLGVDVVYIPAQAQPTIDCKSCAPEQRVCDVHEAL